VMEPPARCRAWRTNFFGFLVEDVEGNNWPTSPEASQEGGIIGKTKIVTEPDD
jgi:hypothetical protein